jgi:hypothetical protein
MAPLETPPPETPARGPGAGLATVLTLLWLGAVVGGVWALEGRGLALAELAALAVVVLAVVLPVALVWLAVPLMAAAAALRAEAARLAARAALPPPAAAVPPEPPAAAAIPPADAATAAALALFVSRREAALAEAGANPSGARAAAMAGAAGEQGGLPLEPPRAAQPLGADELIRVLDFPRDANDTQGFDLLRRALHDPGLADLIRSAEAVLSGLMAEGIELRDLTPDRARPDVWRAFAQGARGPAVAALGGIRDRAVLARAAARMRAEPAFREAAHRFLRAFDLRLAAFEGVASDAQLVRLAETRAARAFMILGRVAGMFG